MGENTAGSLTCSNLEIRRFDWAICSAPFLSVNFGEPKIVTCHCGCCCGCGCGRRCCLHVQIIIIMTERQWDRDR